MNDSRCERLIQGVNDTLNLCYHNRDEGALLRCPATPPLLLPRRLEAVRPAASAAAGAAARCLPRLLGYSARPLIPCRPLMLGRCWCTVTAPSMWSPPPRSLHRRVAAAAHRHLLGVGVPPASTQACVASAREPPLPCAVACPFQSLCFPASEPHAASTARPGPPSPHCPIPRRLPPCLPTPRPPLASPPAWPCSPTLRAPPALAPRQGWAGLARAALPHQVGIGCLRTSLSAAISLCPAPSSPRIGRLHAQVDVPPLPCICVCAKPAQLRLTFLRCSRWTR